MRPLGYPGIRTAVKASSDAVANDVVQQDRPYLCVAYDTEQHMVQPLRVAAFVAGGPIVMYAASQLPEGRGTLKTLTFLIGAGVTAWSAYIWKKADAEMKRGPR
jgi:hypothetical protein